MYQRVSGKQNSALFHDPFLNISTRLELGYEAACWYGMAGILGGGGLTYAPLTKRVDSYAELGVYMALLVGFPPTLL